MKQKNLIYKSHFFLSLSLVISLFLFISYLSYKSNIFIIEIIFYFWNLFTSWVNSVFIGWINSLTDLKTTFDLAYIFESPNGYRNWNQRVDSFFFNFFINVLEKFVNYNFYFSDYFYSRFFNNNFFFLRYFFFLIIISAFFFKLTVYNVFCLISIFFLFIQLKRGTVGVDFSIDYFICNIQTAFTNRNLYIDSNFFLTSNSSKGLSSISEIVNPWLIDYEDFGWGDSFDLQKYISITREAEKHFVTQNIVNEFSPNYEHNRNKPGSFYNRFVKFYQSIIFNINTNYDTSSLKNRIIQWNRYFIPNEVFNVINPNVVNFFWSDSVVPTNSINGISYNKNYLNYDSKKINFLKDLTYDWKNDDFFIQQKNKITSNLGNNNNLNDRISFLHNNGDFFSNLEKSSKPIFDKRSNYIFEKNLQNKKMLFYNKKISINDFLVNRFKKYYINSTSNNVKINETLSYKKIKFKPNFFFNKINIFYRWFPRHREAYSLELENSNLNKYDISDDDFEPDNTHFTFDNYNWLSKKTILNNNYIYDQYQEISKKKSLTLGSYTYFFKSIDFNKQINNDYVEFNNWNDNLNKTSFISKNISKWNNFINIIKYSVHNIDEIDSLSLIKMYFEIENKIGIEKVFKNPSLLTDYISIFDTTLNRFKKCDISEYKNFLKFPIFFFDQSNYNLTEINSEYDDEEYDSYYWDLFSDNPFFSNYYFDDIINVEYESQLNDYFSNTEKPLEVNYLYGNKNMYKNNKTISELLNNGSYKFLNFENKLNKKKTNCYNIDNFSHRLDYILSLYLNYNNNVSDDYLNKIFYTYSWRNVFNSKFNSSGVNFFLKTIDLDKNIIFKNCKNSEHVPIRFKSEYFYNSDRGLDSEIDFFWNNYSSNEKPTFKFKYSNYGFVYNIYNNVLNSNLLMFDDMFLSMNVDKNWFFDPNIDDIGKVSQYFENKKPSYGFLLKENTNSSIFKKNSNFNKKNFEYSMLYNINEDLRDLYNYCLEIAVKNKSNMFNNMGYLVWDELDEDETQEDQLFFDEIYDFQPLEVTEKESNLLLLNFTNSYLLSFLSFYDLNNWLFRFNQIFLYEGKKPITFNKTVVSSHAPKKKSVLYLNLYSFWNTINNTFYNYLKLFYNFDIKAHANYWFFKDLYFNIIYYKISVVFPCKLKVSYYNFYRVFFLKKNNFRFFNSIGLKNNQYINRNFFYFKNSINPSLNFKNNYYFVLNNNFKYNLETYINLFKNYFFIDYIFYEELENNNAKKYIMPPIKKFNFFLTQKQISNSNITDYQKYYYSIFNIVFYSWNVFLNKKYVNESFYFLNKFNILIQDNINSYFLLSKLKSNQIFFLSKSAIFSLFNLNNPYLVKSWYSFNKNLSFSFIKKKKNKVTIEREEFILLNYFYLLNKKLRYSLIVYPPERFFNSGLFTTFFYLNTKSFTRISNFFLPSFINTFNVSSCCTFQNYNVLNFTKALKKPYNIFFYKEFLKINNSKKTFEKYYYLKKIAFLKLITNFNYDKKLTFLQKLNNFENNNYSTKFLVNTVFDIRLFQQTKEKINQKINYIFKDSFIEFKSLSIFKNNLLFSSVQYSNFYTKDFSNKSIISYLDWYSIMFDDFYSFKYFLLPTNFRYKNFYNLKSIVSDCWYIFKNLIDNINFFYYVKDIKKNHYIGYQCGLRKYSNKLYRKFLYNFLIKISWVREYYKPITGFKVLKSDFNQFKKIYLTWFDFLFIYYMKINFYFIFFSKMVYLLNKFSTLYFFNFISVSNFFIGVFIKVLNFEFVFKKSQFSFDPLSTYFSNWNLYFFNFLGDIKLNFFFINVFIKKYYLISSLLQIYLFENERNVDYPFFAILFSFEMFNEFFDIYYYYIISYLKYIILNSFNNLWFEFSLFFEFFFEVLTEFDYDPQHPPLLDLYEEILDFFDSYIIGDEDSSDDFGFLGLFYDNEFGDNPGNDFKFINEFIEFPEKFEEWMMFDIDDVYNNLTGLDGSGLGELAPTFDISLPFKSLWLINALYYNPSLGGFVNFDLWSLYQFLKVIVVDRRTKIGNYYYLLMDNSMFSFHKFTVLKPVLLLSFFIEDIIQIKDLVFFSIFDFSEFFIFYFKFLFSFIGFNLWVSIFFIFFIFYSFMFFIKKNSFRIKKNSFMVVNLIFNPISYFFYRILFHYISNVVLFFKMIFILLFVFSIVVLFSDIFKILNILRIYDNAQEFLDNLSGLYFLVERDPFVEKLTIDSELIDNFKYNSFIDNEWERDHFYREHSSFLGGSNKEHSMVFKTIGYNKNFNYNFELENDEEEDYSVSMSSRDIPDQIHNNIESESNYIFKEMGEDILQREFFREEESYGSEVAGSLDWVNRSTDELDEGEDDDDLEDFSEEDFLVDDDDEDLDENLYDALIMNLFDKSWLWNNSLILSEIRAKPLLFSDNLGSLNNVSVKNKNIERLFIANRTLDSLKNRTSGYIESNPILDSWDSDSITDIGLDINENEGSSIGSLSNVIDTWPDALADPLTQLTYHSPLGNTKDIVELGSIKFENNYYNYHSDEINYENQFEMLKNNRLFGFSETPAISILDNGDDDDDDEEIDSQDLETEKGYIEKLDNNLILKYTSSDDLDDSDDWTDEVFIDLSTDTIIGNVLNYGLNSTHKNIEFSDVFNNGLEILKYDGSENYSRYDSNLYKLQNEAEQESSYNDISFDILRSGLDYWPMSEKDPEFSIVGAMTDSADDDEFTEVMDIDDDWDGVEGNFPERDFITNSFSFEQLKNGKISIPVNKRTQNNYLYSKLLNKPNNLTKFLKKNKSYLGEISKVSSGGGLVHKKNEKKSFFYSFKDLFEKLNYKEVKMFKNTNYKNDIVPKKGYRSETSSNINTKTALFYKFINEGFSLGKNFNIDFNGVGKNYYDPSWIHNVLNDIRNDDEVAKIFKKSTIIDKRKPAANDGGYVPQDDFSNYIDSPDVGNPIFKNNDKYSESELFNINSDNSQILNNLEFLFRNNSLSEDDILEDGEWDFTDNIEELKTTEKKTTEKELAIINNSPISFYTSRTGFSLSDDSKINLLLKKINKNDYNIFSIKKSPWFLLSNKNILWRGDQVWDFESKDSNIIKNFETDYYNVYNKKTKRHNFKLLDFKNDNGSVKLKERKNFWKSLKINYKTFYSNIKNNKTSQNENKPNFPLKSKIFKNYNMRLLNSKDASSIGVISKPKKIKIIRSNNQIDDENTEIGFSFDTDFSYETPALLFDSMSGIRSLNEFAFLENYNNTFNVLLPSSEEHPEQRNRIWKMRKLKKESNINNLLKKPKISENTSSGGFKKKNIYTNIKSPSKFSTFGANYDKSLLNANFFQTGTHKNKFFSDKKKGGFDIQLFYKSFSFFPKYKSALFSFNDIEASSLKKKSYFNFKNNLKNNLNNWNTIKQHVHASNFDRFYLNSVAKSFLHGSDIPNKNKLFKKFKKNNSEITNSFTNAVIASLPNYKTYNTIDYTSITKNNGFSYEQEPEEDMYNNSIYDNNALNNKFQNFKSNESHTFYKSDLLDSSVRKISDFSNYSSKQKNILYGSDSISFDTDDFQNKSSLFELNSKSLIDKNQYGDIIHYEDLPLFEYSNSVDNTFNKISKDKLLVQNSIDFNVDFHKNQNSFYGPTDKNFKKNDFFINNKLSKVMKSKKKYPHEQRRKILFFKKNFNNLHYSNNYNSSGYNFKGTASLSPNTNEVLGKALYSFEDNKKNKVSDFDKDAFYWGNVKTQHGDNNFFIHLYNSFSKNSLKKINPNFTLPLRISYSEFKDFNKKIKNKNNFLISFDSFLDSKKLNTNYNLFNSEQKNSTDLKLQKKSNFGGYKSTDYTFDKNIFKSPYNQNSLILSRHPNKSMDYIDSRLWKTKNEEFEIVSNLDIVNYPSETLSFINFSNKNKKLSKYFKKFENSTNQSTFKSKIEPSGLLSPFFDNREFFSLNESNFDTSADLYCKVFKRLKTSNRKPKFWFNSRLTENLVKSNRRFVVNSLKGVYSSDFYEKNSTEEMKYIDNIGIPLTNNLNKNSFESKVLKSSNTIKNKYVKKMLNRSIFDYAQKRNSKSLRANNSFKYSATESLYPNPIINSLSIDSNLFSNYNVSRLYSAGRLENYLYKPDIQKLIYNGEDDDKDAIADLSEKRNEFLKINETLRLRKKFNIKKTTKFYPYVDYRKIGNNFATSLNKPLLEKNIRSTPNFITSNNLTNFNLKKKFKNFMYSKSSYYLPAHKKKNKQRRFMKKIITNQGKYFDNMESLYKTKIPNHIPVKYFIESVTQNNRPYFDKNNEESHFREVNEPNGNISFIPTKYEWLENFYRDEVNTYSELDPDYFFKKINNGMSTVYSDFYSSKGNIIDKKRFDLKNERSSAREFFFKNNKNLSIFTNFEESDYATGLDYSGLNLEYQDMPVFDPKNLKNIVDYNKTDNTYEVFESFDYGRNITDEKISSNPLGDIVSDSDIDDIIDLTIAPIGITTKNNFDINYEIYKKKYKKFSKNLNPFKFRKRFGIFSKSNKLENIKLNNIRFNKKNNYLDKILDSYALNSNINSNLNSMPMGGAMSKYFYYNLIKNSEEKKSNNISSITLKVLNQKKFEKDRSLDKIYDFFIDDSENTDNEDYQNSVAIDNLENFNNLYSNLGQNDTEKYDFLGSKMFLKNYISKSGLKNSFSKGLVNSVEKQSSYNDNFLFRSSKNLKTDVTSKYSDSISKSFLKNLDISSKYINSLKNTLINPNTNQGLKKNFYKNKNMNTEHSMFLLDRFVKTSIPFNNNVSSTGIDEITNSYLEFESPKTYNNSINTYSVIGNNKSFLNSLKNNLLKSSSEYGFYDESGRFIRNIKNENISNNNSRFKTFKKFSKKKLIGYGGYKNSGYSKIRNTMSLLGTNYNTFLPSELTLSFISSLPQSATKILNEEPKLPFHYDYLENKTNNEKPINVKVNKGSVGIETINNSFGRYPTKIVDQFSIFHKPLNFSDYDTTDNVFNKLSLNPFHTFKDKNSLIQNSLSYGNTDYGYRNSLASRRSIDLSTRVFGPDIRTNSPNWGYGRLDPNLDFNMNAEEGGGVLSGLGEPQYIEHNVFDQDLDIAAFYGDWLDPWSGSFKEFFWDDEDFNEDGDLDDIDEESDIVQNFGLLGKGFLAGKFVFSNIFENDNNNYRFNAKFGKYVQTENQRLLEDAISETEFVNEDMWSNSVDDDDMDWETSVSEVLENDENSLDIGPLGYEEGESIYDNRLLNRGWFPEKTIWGLRGRDFSKIGNDPTVLNILADYKNSIQHSEVDLRSLNNTDQYLINSGYEKFDSLVSGLGIKEDIPFSPFESENQWHMREHYSRDRDLHFMDDDDWDEYEPEAVDLMGYNRLALSDFVLGSKSWANSNYLANLDQAEVPGSSLSLRNDETADGLLTDFSNFLLEDLPPDPLSKINKTVISKTVDSLFGDDDTHDSSVPEFSYYTNDYDDDDEDDEDYKSDEESEEDDEDFFMQETFAPKDKFNFAPTDGGFQLFEAEWVVNSEGWLGNTDSNVSVFKNGTIPINYTDPSISIFSQPKGIFQQKFTDDEDNFYLLNTPFFNMGEYSQGKPIKALNNDMPYSPILSGWNSRSEETDDVEENSDDWFSDDQPLTNSLFDGDFIIPSQNEINKRDLWLNLIRNGKLSSNIKKNISLSVISFNKDSNDFFLKNDFKLAFRNWMTPNPSKVPFNYEFENGEITKTTNVLDLDFLSNSSDQKNENSLLSETTYGLFLSSDTNFNTNTEFFSVKIRKLLYISINIVYIIYGLTLSNINQYTLLLGEFFISFFLIKINILIIIFESFLFKLYENFYFLYVLTLVLLKIFFFFLNSFYRLYLIVSDINIFIGSSYTNISFGTINLTDMYNNFVIFFNFLFRLINFFFFFWLLLVSILYFCVLFFL